jgi:hypothetical protein
MAEATFEPLPALVWDGYFWSGSDTLTTWGRMVQVSVSATTSPAPEQIAAYAHLKAHEALIAERVLGAILDLYNGGERDSFLAAVGAEDAELLPAVGTTTGMRQLVNVASVHVLDVVKDGHAYLGLELGCRWDNEHGLGVMMHQGRVLAVGPADRSFDPWIGRSDGGTDLPVVEPAKPPLEGLEFELDPDLEFEIER